MKSLPPLLTNMSKSNYFEKGLTTGQVQKQIKKYGYNEIPIKKEFSLLKILLSQFASFLIIVLIGAGGISIFLGEIVDGIAIFCIVFLNAIIGFIQEYKAENAVSALKKMVVPVTIVLRNGQEQELPIKELVPDDIIILSEGDKIPADLELIEAYSLKIDESILTGESVASNKKAGGKGREILLFKGTLVTTGRAKAKVIGTGINTEFGKIIKLVSKQKKTRSPLSEQLDQLGKKLGIVVLIMITILFGLGFLRQIPALEMLMTSVALGVSAIPEGMPIIVTLTLALGVQTLARQKAIVRKMNSIETLGATTIICSDKTGTLTLNEMTVKKIYTWGKEEEIPGIGYKLKEKISLKTPEEKRLIEICENCNNAFFDKNILGDPTEIALKVLARKASFKKTYKRLDENVFTSERKMMSSLHKIGREKIIFAKGAFEEILEKSTQILKNGEIKRLTPTDRKQIKKLAEEYSLEALRVLAYAYKKHTGKFDEKDLIFVGLTGMIDPPRKTVKKSIEIAQRAGIQVKIVTGDNALTAKAVGEKIGLEVENIITGDQLDRLSDKKLLKLLPVTQIFARTKPEHKYRIVNLLKKHGDVVAVTGDGVNDAPALKHANVGIAMGIKGTEATKEVADIVLKDDNFSTIVTTIKEGRRIYHNILAFIKYMLSANFITIVVVAIVTILGYPLPILPLQILWLNIATDALPALALGNSPAAKGIMEEKPHPKKENIFKKFFGFILIAGLIQTVVNLLLYFYGLEIDKSLGINTAELHTVSHARTFVFTQTVVFELLFAFVCKEEKLTSIKSMFSNKSLIGAFFISFTLHLIMIYAPFMQTIFKVTPLTLSEWGLIFLGASTAFLIPSITNTVRKIFRK